MSSIIVLGLGGTGIKTLVHVKKMLQDSNPLGEVPGNIRLMGIDTRSTPEQVTNIGAWTSVASRRQGVNPNKSQLNPYTEYYWIGGNAELEVCGDGRNNLGWPSDHFTSTWFDQRYFRNHPNHSSLLNIIDGAGMYPPVGRLGLFYHLRSGTNSPLYNVILKMIQGLPGQTIEVVLIASLAGGTGSSLFIDMAHLSRVIAENEHKSVRVTAMLVMPGGFRWNPPVSVDDAMQVRAMQSLRSLLRFSTIHNADLGFFFQYTANRNDESINRRTRGALFDMVYLMDERALGQGQVQIDNPLDVPISDGMAPTMGAWVSALCDGTISAEANAWIANMRAIEAGQDFQGLVPGFSCSFGTFSIILPLSAIIENWTAELGSEVLNELLPQQEDGTVDGARSGGVPSLSGSAQARRDWDKQAARVSRDAGKTGMTWSPETENALVAAYRSRSVQDWLEIFIDRRTSEKDVSTFEKMREKNTFYYNETAGFWNDPFKDALARPIPRRAMGGNPAAAANSLHERCDEAYEEASATWVAALKDAVTRQVDEQRGALDAFVAATLNGDPHDVALAAKSGKPGWLFDYVHQQKEDLNHALKVLDLAINSARADVGAAESEWVAGGKGQAGLLQQMRQDDKRQKDYLKKRQSWLEGRRWLLLAETYRSALSQMLSYTTAMEAQLKSFIDALLGLKAALETFQEDIDKRRKQAQKDFSRVREMVYDEDWEDGQYMKYHNLPNRTPADEVVMSHLNWGIRQVTRNKQTVPAISMHIEGFDLVANSALESNELSIDPAASEEQRVRVNQARLMEICRQQFAEAWQNLTVVDYLIHAYDGVTRTAVDLAAHLHRKGNALLTAGIGNCVTPSWSVNLLAPADGGNSVLLQSTRDQLRNMTGAAAQFAKVLEHNDPTTLTYITIVMGVEISKLSAFRNPQMHYLQQMPVESIGTEISRKLNYIFPADRNVAQYDRILISGEPRLVPPRINNVMEDEGRLAEWLDAWALGIIQQSPVTLANNQVGDLFRLCLTETVNLRGDLQEQEVEYWLNDPYSYTGGLADTLVSAEAYCLRVREHSGKRLPMMNAYPLVRRTIEAKLQERLAEFKPWWEQNNGTATAIAVYRQPDSKVRDTLLLQETRKEMYRRLSPRIAARLDDLNAVPPRNASATTLRTLEDEREFLTILEWRIQQITSHAPLLS